MIFFFKQKMAYDLLISDWSSDVCSSDLKKLVFRTDEYLRSAATPRIVEQAEDFFLILQFVEQLPHPVQMLSRAFIDKVRLPAHDQDRPMFAVSRPYGKATLDQLPARAIQSRAAGVTVLLQGPVRLRQGQTSKLAADIIGGFGKAGETNPRRQVDHAIFNAAIITRSEERRVGKECVSTCRTRWW